MLHFPVYFRLQTNSNAVYRGRQLPCEARCLDGCSVVIQWLSKERDGHWLRRLPQVYYLGIKKDAVYSDSSDII